MNKLNELTSEEKYIIQEKGTERPFTGKYNDHSAAGLYVCKQCDAHLYSSEHKFQSHCGWPSFDQSIKGSVTYLKATSFGMERTEIICSNCGGHLGHVFNDGPTQTGQRYCVNSLSVDFEK